MENWFRTDNLLFLNTIQAGPNTRLIYILVKVKQMTISTRDVVLSSISQYNGNKSVLMSFFFF